jgi:hypothetical protein
MLFFYISGLRFELHGQGAELSPEFVMVDEDG